MQAVFGRTNAKSAGTLRNDSPAKRRPHESVKREKAGKREILNKTQSGKP